MRKIVTRGLYTYMDGMCPGTKFAGNVEMNEPLKQEENNGLEGLVVDGRGNEEGIAQNSRTTPTFYEELGCRLKFMAWQRIISHRKQRRAALLSETHNSGLI
jgi:hypothetical protein